MRVARRGPGRRRFGPIRPAKSSRSYKWVRESLGERGGTVVVDELGAKLHSKLLRYVILLFQDPEVNKNGAQLIFSPQDVSAMRNDVFRRDEVWFAARAEGEASQLWSLADIHEANGKEVLGYILQAVH